MVQVRIYATLRPIVGGAIVNTDVQPGDTVRKLMDELTTRWPALRRELLDEDGQLLDRVHVLINGRSVKYLNCLDTVIPAGAQIAIFPPVGGG